MKKKRSNTTLLKVIALMLILVIASSIWILHRGYELNIARAKEEAAMEREEAQKKAEEEAAIAQQEAEDAAVTSHVYSHRGSAGPKEHSFEAYDAAIEAGSRYIEQDVVITSDGVLYVSHDLNAVTMTGYNGMFEYLTSETVDGLTTEAGNKVLRLSDVFEKYGHDINYVIELKAHTDACVEAFEKLVDEYGLSDVITVQSMYADVLETLEAKYPDMPKLYVCWSQGDFEYVVDKPYVDIISVKAAAGLMTQENCDATHANGKLFSAWTLDDEDTIKKAIDMGVDTYFTNDTPLALSLEREYGLERRGGQ
jgi:glycerophosphoryl diester phosphodiesterase